MRLVQNGSLHTFTQLHGFEKAEAWPSGGLRLARLAQGGFRLNDVNDGQWLTNPSNALWREGRTAWCNGPLRPLACPRKNNLDSCHLLCQRPLLASSPVGTLIIHYCIQHPQPTANSHRISCGAWAQCITGPPYRVEALYVNRSGGGARHTVATAAGTAETHIGEISDE